MRRANEITVRAHRAVFASLSEGMAHDRAVDLTVEAHRRLGVDGGALVLFSRRRLPAAHHQAEEPSQGYACHRAGRQDARYAETYPRRRLRRAAERSQAQRLGTREQAQDTCVPRHPSRLRSRRIDAAAARGIETRLRRPTTSYYTRRPRQRQEAREHLLRARHTTRSSPHVSARPGITSGELAIRRSIVVVHAAGEHDTNGTPRTRRGVKRTARGRAPRHRATEAGRWRGARRLGPTPSTSLWPQMKQSWRASARGVATTAKCASTSCAPGALVGYAMTAAEGSKLQGTASSARGEGAARSDQGRGVAAPHADAKGRFARAAAIAEAFRGIRRCVGPSREKRLAAPARSR